ncbi:hypothetical protein Q5P01_000178, partial [Channa striata]
MCLDQGPVPGNTPIAYNCYYYGPQFSYYRKSGELYIGGIKSHKYNDNRCLTDVGNKETQPGLYNCKEAMQKGMGIYWDFTQVWTCGGSIEVVPCSKIAHIERAHEPYMPDLSPAMKRNALRVAEVWMDEYKHNINLAWNIPFEMKNLNASMCLDQGPVPGNTPIAYNCYYYGPQFSYYRKSGELYIGGIKSHKCNDNRCLTDVGNKETQPGLYNCKEAMQKGMGIYWDFTQ